MKADAARTEAAPPDLLSGRLHDNHLGVCAAGEVRRREMGRRPMLCVIVPERLRRLPGYQRYANTKMQVPRNAMNLKVALCTRSDNVSPPNERTPEPICHTVAQSRIPAPPI